MIEITVYCDTTGQYSEEECSLENLCEMEFPKEMVQEFSGCKTDEEFKVWLDEYTADDTDGLYDYCEARGFKAKRG